ncbi:MAG: peptidase sortase [Modestobacter sp.]|nr:peptidase sortase [Modestobacter sp.]
MRTPRIGFLTLVLAGAACIVVGLLLTRTTPRADAPDLGPPVAAAPGSPGAPDLGPPATPATASRQAAIPTQPEVAAAPTSVSLPGTREPVPLVPVGVLGSGALALPDLPSVLGWYAAGATPGDPVGTVVVAGHVDSARYGVGPLRGLLDLRLGDPIQVRDAGGGTHRYEVASRTSYPKAALPPEAFRLDGPPRLALVTCGGAFDRRAGQYADNVVVLAAAVPAAGPTGTGRPY